MLSTNAHPLVPRPLRAILRAARASASRRTDLDFVDALVPPGHKPSRANNDFRKIARRLEARVAFLERELVEVEAMRLSALAMLAEAAAAAEDRGVGQ
jgi:hypothetical protein